MAAFLAANPATTFQARWLAANLPPASWAFTRSAEGAVGIVVDGVPQGNVNISNIFDMQRVEVLRGPQGTLFGLTSSAGVINMTTVAPNSEGFEANFRFEYSGADDAGSQFGEQVARGVVNVPLGEHQALRVSGTYQQDEGVQHNNFSGEDSDQRDVSVRARYRFAPSDRFRNEPDRGLREHRPQLQ